jgi:hypothetical protein
MCLGSITARANLEHELLEKHEENSAEDQARFARNQKAGMEEQALWQALSSRERSLMEKPLGTWEEQEAADGEWRKDSAVVLLWALGQGGELLPYDKEADDLALPPFDDARKFINGAKLRSSEEIEKGRQAAELWLRRARTTQLQMEHVDPPKGMTFETIIGITAEGAEHSGYFKAVGKDFPAHGKPYSQLSEDEWETMRSIATERLYAFNWLCGYSADWDKVPTGT